ncbi:transcriptional regulator with XRE-family HTH domain [Hamadaea flava]|uniref:Helix-turn-helix domain-containing protein n=1 Tax=Hamadaea flava TaxID=1742688 RepID=A0ABV8LS18_9ACTN|nr:XRE family transcriptional regulator [Hamadaea flava]MCP2327361.1 transcriptional regulator with XRE-family HTH domain [Hamadaea flava]
MEDSVVADTSPVTASIASSAEELNAAVALHVRALRTGRGWSLDELSGRSGVSKGMLVQIEGARTNPSIGTLSRVADAFGVTVARLLEPAVDRTVHVSEYEEAPVLWRGGRGGTARLLRGLQDTELWDWRLAPHETHSPDDHRPGTREVISVLAGTLVVTVGGEEHTVYAGQTIDLIADRTHTYANPTDVPARFMMLVTMPPREHDRRLIRQRT